MILVWNNIHTFQQHLEDMRAFRQSHTDDLRGELTMFKNMPTLCDNIPPCNTTTGRHVIKNKEKTVIVPIWKIILPKGIQN